MYMTNNQTRAVSYLTSMTSLQAHHNNYLFHPLLLPSSCFGFFSCTFSVPLSNHSDWLIFDIAEPFELSTNCAQTERFSNRLVNDSTEQQLNHPRMQCMNWRWVWRSSKFLSLRQRSSIQNPGSNTLLQWRQEVNYLNNILGKDEGAESGIHSLMLQSTAVSGARVYNEGGLGSSVQVQWV